MNPLIAADLAASHIRDLRWQAGRCRTVSSSRPTPSPPGGTHTWPRLRSRIGFTLVAAGLHLLAGSEGAPGVTRTSA